jgi:capsular exopolysaccharide synthesis family protein
LLAAASNIPDVRVLDPAVPPEEPRNAKDRPRFILLAFLASLGLGVGAAIMLDRIDPRVKSPDELGRLGLRILGTVPHVNTGHPADSLGNVAEVVEAFRLIRLNVTHAHGTAGPIVLAITSPMGSEGKSFVSSNLGLAYSFLGLRTVVIDADVRRGRVHRLLGGDRRPGLTDFLGGAAALEQVVKPTQYPALFRISSGSRRQDGPELLQSAAMASLVADLRSSYDVLIIDTPPIGVGADALALATLARNLVVVVRTGSTNRELTETKLDFIFRLPVRVLGAILNDVPARGAYGYYGSAYYSSYLPGYESKDEEAF